MGSTVGGNRMVFPMIIHRSIASQGKKLHEGSSSICRQQMPERKGCTCTNGYRIHSSEEGIVIYNQNTIIFTHYGTYSASWKGSSLTVLRGRARNQASY